MPDPGQIGTAQQKFIVPFKRAFFSRFCLKINLDFKITTRADLFKAGLLVIKRSNDTNSVICFTLTYSHIILNNVFLAVLLQCVDFKSQLQPQ